MHHHTELDGEHVSRYSAPLKKWNGLIYRLQSCSFHFFTYLHKNHVNGLHKTFSQRIQIKNSPWYRAENVKPALHIKTKCRQTSDILNLYINILHMYTSHLYQHYKIKHQYHYNDGYSALAHLSYFSHLPLPSYMTMRNLLKVCKIWGSHGSEYEE